MTLNLSGGLRYFRVTVFEFVRLIKYQVVEIMLLEVFMTNGYTLISGYANIKETWNHLVVQNVFSELHCGYQIDNFEERSPYFEFSHPVRNS